MNRIQLLDEKTANRIAAGEVVTRPSAVLKELCENAIDADATAITVEIENGGMKQIYVSDNGTGIHPEDMPLAFLRHATGKTRSGEDLFGMETLGFRGEALSSIAAVSMIRMNSRLPGADMGYYIALVGGTIREKREIGCPEGTGIYVENLFYNTPARMKHMKSVGAETANCTDTIIRLILAYPMISIRYLSNHNLVYHSPGTGLKDAILTVYGQEVYANILPVAFKTDLVRIEGFVGKPVLSRKNRNLQTTIMNNRLIRSQRISNGVTKAFSERNMVGRFPFYVLHICTVKERIDVNIHPQKLEVKLLDEDYIVLQIIQAVSQVFTPKEDVRVATIHPQVDAEVQEPSQENTGAQEMQSNSIPELYQKMADAFTGQLPNQSSIVVADRAVPAVFVGEESYGSKAYAAVEMPGTYHSNEIPRSNQGEEIKQAIPLSQDTIQNDNVAIQQESLDETILFLMPFRVIGQLFLTYLLVEIDTSLYLIDQHAAHERLNYDRYLGQINRDEVAVQSLILPQSITLSPDDIEEIRQKQILFRKIGFEIEPFGPSTAILRGVPLILADGNVTDAVQSILTEITNMGDAKSSDIILERMVRASCRMSIKAGEGLDQAEISALMMLLAKSDKLTCPHGRPIAIRITKRELERNFKRIQ